MIRAYASATGQGLLTCSFGLMESAMRQRRMTTRRWMLAVLVFAVIAWVGVLCWRRAHFLELSRRYREQATIYAEWVSQHVDAVSLVADLERVVAGAEPPVAGSEIGAFNAYREYIADLQRRIRIANSELDA
jgi:hypothetical protein